MSTSYTPDTMVKSLLWGRLGAAVLAALSAGLATYGYSFGSEEQETTFNAISGIIASLAAILSVASKFREKKKV